jgi:hypothetical protein
MRRRWGLLVVAVLAALTLAGCPSGSNSCPAGSNGATCGTDPGPGY